MNWLISFLNVIMIWIMQQLAYALLGLGRWEANCIPNKEH